MKKLWQEVAIVERQGCAAAGLVEHVVSLLVFIAAFQFLVKLTVIVFLVSPNFVGAHALSMSTLFNLYLNFRVN
jgi:hypothetical protein